MKLPDYLLVAFIFGLLISIIGTTFMTRWDNEELETMRDTIYVYQKTDNRVNAWTGTNYYGKAK